MVLWDWWENKTLVFYFIFWDRYEGSGKLGFLRVVEYGVWLANVANYEYFMCLCLKLMHNVLIIMTCC